jgi:GPH family glycoside/pentoside/hexuronide:cation symporter
VNRPHRVDLGTKIAFGLGAGGEATQYVAFNTFSLIYFNQVLGLSGTLSGLVTTLALITDAISDPMVGSLSDRWHSRRLGRRHPFLYGAPIPAALCFLALFFPPSFLAGYSLFGWLTVFAVLLRFSMTFFQVPHLALGGELSDDYIERSSVMSYNSLLSNLIGGSFWLLSYAVIFPATADYARGVLNPAGWPVFGIVGAAAIVVNLLASAHFTRKEIPRLPKAPTGLPAFRLLGVLQEMGDALRNSNYRALVLGLMFLSGTIGIHQTLSLHLNTYFWGLTSEQLTLFVFSGPVGFMAAFLLAPKLNARFDKRPTIVMAVAGTTLFSALPVCLRLLGWFPDNGHPALVWLLVANIIFPISFGGILNITVMSCLADLADENELATGRRQEGILYSARTFFGKATSSVGHLLAGIGLDVIGFPEKAVPGEISTDVLFDLGLLYAPIAAVPALISVYCYGLYKIDRRRHDEIVAELSERRAGSVERAAPRG